MQGNIRCWGFGPDGQPGIGVDGNVGDDETPAERGGYAHVIDSTALPSGLSSGAASRHSCVINNLARNEISCWGKGSDYQLGTSDDEHIGDDEIPTWTSVGGHVIQVATGGRHSCALLENRRVECWGRGDQGQLGYGNALTVGDDEESFAAGPVDDVDPSTRLR